MMTLNEVTVFIHESARQFGYEELASIEVTQNNRLRTCLGKCYTNISKAQPEKIEMSGKLLKAGTVEDIKQVALHELAHAIVVIRFGVHVQAHGKEFKQVCKEIGCAHVGARNSVSFDEKAQMNDYPYVLECPQCGEKWYFKTKCKKIQHPDWYACGKCNVSLTSRRVA